MKDEQVFITYQHRELLQSLRWARSRGHSSVMWESQKQEALVKEPGRMDIAGFRFDGQSCTHVIEPLWVCLRQRRSLGSPERWSVKGAMASVSVLFSAEKRGCVMNSHLAAIVQSRGQLACETEE